jgi:hypothetical protein
VLKAEANCTVLSYEASILVRAPNSIHLALGILLGEEFSLEP